MHLHFDNITISGGVAVGKNTLLENLRPYLEPLHWQFRYTGQIVRDYLKEYVRPNASLAPDELHRQIDSKVLDILSNHKKWVIEGWLPGFLSRKLDNTLRVLLVCSQPSLQIDRVANRDHITVAEAKQFIKSRMKDNFETFKNLYGDHDFFDPQYYHFVIDTYSSGQLETVGKVLDALGYRPPHK